MTDFKFRAVVTDLEDGYVVSVSKLSSAGDTTILSEEEVDSLTAAHALMKQVASGYSYSVDAMEKWYNIRGNITNKPPRGSK